MAPTLGPVDVIVVPIDDDHAVPRLLRRLSAITASGAVRILDYVEAWRNDYGDVEWRDIDVDEFALAGVDVRIPGLATVGDIDAAIDKAAAGAWAVVTVEIVSTPDPDTATLIAGLGRVTRISAAVANAVLDLALDDDMMPGAQAPRSPRERER